MLNRCSLKSARNTARCLLPRYQHTRWTAPARRKPTATATGAADSSFSSGAGSMLVCCYLVVCVGWLPPSLLRVIDKNHVLIPCLPPPAPALTNSTLTGTPGALHTSHWCVAAAASRSHQQVFRCAVINKHSSLEGWVVVSEPAEPQQGLRPQAHNSETKGERQ